MNAILSRNMGKIKALKKIERYYFVGNKKDYPLG